MKNLDDLYQELLIKDKKMKSSLLKAGGSALLGLGGIVNPYLFLMFYLEIGYGIRMLYNFIQICSSMNTFNTSNIKLYEEYIQLNSCYRCLISEIRQNIFQKLNITEPMEIFAVSYYMILNGFLSINHEFYDEGPIDYCKFTLGTSIVRGSGVCRNLAPFLTDLLKECNYESYNVHMALHGQQKYRLSADYYNSYVVEDAGVYSEDEEICSGKDQKVLLKNLLQKLFSNQFNHIGTLLANNDESYIMDPMNNTFYCIHGKYVFPYFSNDEVKTNLIHDRYDKKIKIPYVSSAQLDKEKMVELYRNACLMCDDSFYTFQRFYFEHKELYEEIVFQRKEFVEKQMKIKSLLYK